RRRGARRAVAPRAHGLSPRRAAAGELRDGSPRAGGDRDVPQPSERLAFRARAAGEPQRGRGGCTVGETMMRVERFTDVARFYDLAAPPLMQHEAENNFELGLAARLRHEAPDP